MGVAFVATLFWELIYSIFSTSPSPISETPPQYVKEIREAVELKGLLPMQRSSYGSWQSRSLGAHSTCWQKPYDGRGLLRGSLPKANTNPWLMVQTHFETLLGCSLTCCPTVGESLKREPSGYPTTTLAYWRFCKSTTTFYTQPRAGVSLDLPRNPQRNSRRSWRRCSRRGSCIWLLRHLSSPATEGSLLLRLDSSFCAFR